MFVLAASFDLHLPGCRSLKDKRSVLRPVLHRLRSGFEVSVAEVGDQDLLQRSHLGVAVVSGSEQQAVEVVDGVERFIWQAPGVEVISVDRWWLESD